MLFIGSNHRTQASLRFRVLQFFAPLAAAGHEPILSSFFGEHPAPRLSRRVLDGVRVRMGDLVRSRRVDRIIVHREAFPMAWNDWGRLFPKHVPLIFDFDDAVYLPTQKGWRGLVSRPASTKLLAQRADAVFAGNEYLAEYAARLNPRVKIVPTVLDTDFFVPAAPAPPRQRLRVGWVGGPSTARYLPPVLDVLDRLARSFAFDVRIVGADRAFALSNIAVESRSWRLEEEVTAFQDIDIGIYPLADDEWSRGKCGFKAIQYMACGIPFVVNPVGVVRSIVRDGVDGLWASSDEQWAAGLAALLQDGALRRRLADAGRERVCEHYSVKRMAARWISDLERPAEVKP